MIRRAVSVFVLGVMALSPCMASAYEANVELSPNLPRPGSSFDLVVVTIKNRAVLSSQSRLYDFDKAKTGGLPTFLVPIENSVRLIRPSKFTAPGLKPSVSIDSIDYLHNMAPPATQFHGTYDIRLYFNTDFMWVEMKESGDPRAYVYSSVFFVGVPEWVYKYFMEYGADDGSDKLIYHYARLSDLKKDIQENYADKALPLGSVKEAKSQPIDRNRRYRILSQFLSSYDYDF